MKIGSRWLFAALAGSILAVPGFPRPAQAQDDAPAPADAPVAAPTVETRPGQQLFYQKPLPIRPGTPISVLAFPFGYGGEEEAAAAPAEAAVPAEGAATAAPTTAPKSELSLDQQDLLNYATAAVKAGFLSSPLYALVTYHPQSSLVQRAVSQEVLRKEQLLNIISTKTGATNTDRARVITEHLSMQTLLVGTVDKKSDVKANSTEVTLSAQLIHSVTGEVLRTAAASGAAQGAEGVPMLQVEQRAALDAAQKLLPALGIELVRLPAPPVEVAPANGKGKSAKAAPKSRSKKAPATVPAPAAPAASPSSLAAPAGSPEQAAAPAPAPRRENASADRDAEKQAKEAARAARRQAETDRKAAEEAQKAAREASRKAERYAARRQARNVTPATDAQADQQPAAAPAAEGQVAPAARSSAGVTVPSATGTSSYDSGLPVPYGYAIGESKTIAPVRNKSGLKVPAWLGVAGFLTGISFLL